MSQNDNKKIRWNPSRPYIVQSGSTPLMGSLGHFEGSACYLLITTDCYSPDAGLVDTWRALHTISFSSLCSPGASKSLPVLLWTGLRRQTKQADHTAGQPLRTYTQTNHTRGPHLKSKLAPTLHNHKKPNPGWILRLTEGTLRSSMWYILAPYCCFI